MNYKKRKPHLKNKRKGVEWHSPKRYKIRREKKIPIVREEIVEHIYREKVKKLYVISATTCTSLKEAEEKLESWSECGTLNTDSMVYEVGVIYQPRIKLIKRE